MAASMNQVIRTTLAYLVAPVAGPAVMGIAEAVAEHSSGAPLKTFGSVVLIGCLTSYPLSWVFGTVVFLVLRQLRRETYLLYGACAAIVGVCYAVAMGWRAPANDTVVVSVMFGLVALPVGILFRAIRGRSQTANPSPVHNAHDLP